MEPLQVGVASPFVWSTFMQRASGLGIFAEYEVAAPAQASQLSAGGPSGRRKAKKASRPKSRRGATMSEASASQKAALRSQVAETVA